MSIFAVRYIVDYEEVDDFAVIGDADRVNGGEWCPGVGTPFGKRSKRFIQVPPVGLPSTPTPSS